MDLDRCSIVSLAVKSARKRGNYLEIKLRNGNSTTIHSRYDPVREAQTWVREVHKENQNQPVLLIGGGLGYIPDQLRTEGIIYSVIEILPKFSRPAESPDPEGTEPANFVRIDDVEDPNQALDLIPVSRLNNARIITHPGYEQLIPEIDSFKNNLIVTARGKLRNIQSRFQLMEWGSTNLYNLINRKRAYIPFQSLRNQYSDCPAILAGAGPSLSKTFPWLREIQDQVLLVSVDSACISLSRAGIQPDVTISMDPQPENALHIEGVEPMGTLVSSVTVEPEYCRWGESIPHVLFYLSRDSAGESPTAPFVEWFLKECRDFGSLQSGGSVTTTALDMLFQMGCDPIAIVGVDHAFTDGRVVPPGSNREQKFLQRCSRFHTLAGQHLAWMRNLETDKGKQLQQVRSREEMPVVTMDEYQLQNRWFEEASEILPRTLLDFRHDGLRMAGWDVIDDPQQYIETYHPDPITFSPIAQPSKRFDIESIQNRALQGLGQLPENLEQFLDCYRRNNRSDTTTAWETFVEPLEEYHSIQNDVVSQTDLIDYYQQLIDNLKRFTDFES